MASGGARELFVVERDVAVDATAANDVQRGGDGGATNVAGGEIAKPVLSCAPEANPQLLQQLVEILLVQSAIVRDPPGEAREARDE